MTDLDLFFPGRTDWTDAGATPPDSVREQLPQLNWDKTVVRQRALPFYPGARLLVMRGADWAPPNLFIYALHKGDSVHLLQGTSPPIHTFNAEGHLALTPETVVPYLQFFSFFVRGDEGPFYLVARRDAPYLPNGLRQGTSAEGLADAQRDFEARYQSPRTFGRSGDGKWRCSGTIMYSNAVFIADFLIQTGGMVEMLNDTPVLADLPIKIWAPIAPVPEVNATLH